MGEGGAYRGYLTTGYIPRGGALDGVVVKFPILALPPTGGGGGISLIGALTTRHLLRYTVLLKLTKTRL